jgi:hypothetical protein
MKDKINKDKTEKEQLKKERRERPPSAAKSRPGTNGSN